MFDTYESSISSATPVATLSMISFSAVLPRMSTWSAVVPPPRGIVGTGLCGICGHTCVSTSTSIKTFENIADLDGNNLHPRRIPSLSLPPLSAHRTKTEQADGAVALAHLDAIHDLRVNTVVGIFRVDPRLAREWEIKRSTWCDAIGAVVAGGVVCIRLDVVVFILSAGVPVRALGSLSKRSRVYVG